MLKPEQRNAIQFILEGNGYSETAKRLGITRVTLWRWRDIPEFQEELERQRGNRMVELRAQCDGAGEEALMTLIAVMRDPDSGPSARVRAACSILDRCGLTVQPKEVAPQVFTLAPSQDETPESFVQRLTKMARDAKEQEQN